MKVMLLKYMLLLLSVLATRTLAECPVTVNPVDLVNCLRYLTSGALGAALKDLKMICAIAADISNCAKRELAGCVAEEIGRAALTQISDIAENCCPERNNPRCTIRDELVNEQRCFAADSFVTLSDGNRKLVSDLQPGDSLLAYDDQTKKIVSTRLLTMLDFQPHRFALFKQVTTTTGRQLSLSSSHMLPTDVHGYIMAKHIRIGMNVYVMNDKGEFFTETVSNVSDIVKQGYMAPLTEEGTLIVNDIAASCYSTINSHYVAHGVLAPMRWWYRLMGISNKSNSMIGVHWFPKMVYEITTFLLPSIIH